MDRLKVCILAIAQIGSAALGSRAIAQITPDTTLPINSEVTREGNRLTIDAGTLSENGSTLFHSFSQFNIGTEESALFNNGLNVDNILTRVTGGRLSNIDGALEANGMANLFLLNPSGIQFGPNASLNIGGSFVGSTAEAFIFTNGGVYSATNPVAPPLLSVTVPLGLQYGPTPSPIQVQGSNLQTSSGQTLTLVGGNLSIIGGQLRAPGGRISLGSAAEGILNLDESLGIVEPLEIGDRGIVTLDQQSSVVVTGVSGGIDVVTGTLSITGNSLVRSLTSEASSLGNGGNITLKSDTIQISNESLVEAVAFGSGDGGSINISASEDIRVISSMLIADTFDAGNGGNISITASNVRIADDSLLNTATFGTGDGGNIVITADDFELVDSAPDMTLSLENAEPLTFNTPPRGLNAATFGPGDGGSINVTVANDFQVANSALNATSFNSSILQDSGSFDSGSGGSISITANDVQVTGSVFASDTFGVGNGGNISITASNVRIADDSLLNTAALGSGNSGDIIIAADDFELVDSAPDMTLSLENAEPLTFNTPPRGLNAATFGPGDGGSINVTVANDFQVANSALNATSFNSSILQDSGSFDSGSGGSISITANDVQVTGSVFASDTFGVGNGGNISITASNVRIADDSLLNTAALGSGNSGDIIIAADDFELVDSAPDMTLSLENAEPLTFNTPPRGLNAATFGPGDGGSINVTVANDFQVANSALNATSFNSSILQDSGSFDSGSGGSISITANDVQVTGSVFASDTFGVGNGGNISITASNVRIAGDSLLNTAALGSGNSGDIIIAADDFELVDSAPDMTLSLENAEPLTFNTPPRGLNAATFGPGDGGSINVTVANDFQVANSALNATSFNSSILQDSGSFDSGSGGSISITANDVQVTGSVFASDTFGVGNGGNISITASNVRIADDSLLNTAALGSGNSGDIIIAADDFELVDSAPDMTLSLENAEPLTFNTPPRGLNAATFGPGDGGSINVTVANDFQVANSALNATSFNSSILQDSGSFDSGSGGSISITANDVQVTGSVFASDTFGVGNGGNISITASNVRIAGDSLLNTAALGSGNSGDIIIAADDFELVDSAPDMTLSLENAEPLTFNTPPRGLNAATFGPGDGGSINVTVANDFQVANSALNAESLDSGDAGGVRVEAQGVSLTNDSIISVNTQGSSTGGSILLLTDNLTLAGESSITAETDANQGGDIELTIANNLLLQSGSGISSTANTGGDGGNLTIDASLIIAPPLENSDITANAFEGNGGNVDITTNGIFGIAFRPEQTFLSDITASSEFGLSGTVSISDPDVDPTSGLIELPTQAIDPSDLVVAGCAAGSGNSFAVVGRGGLPTDPTATIRGQTVLSDLRDFITTDAAADLPPVKKKVRQQIPTEIVQVTGWAIDQDGEIELVAASPQEATTLKHLGCQDLSRARKTI